MTASHILSLHCPDRPGLVAAVAGAIFDAGGNITDARQFDDKETRRFFMRVVFEGAATNALHERLAALAATNAMTWRLRPVVQRTRTLLMVSRFDHALGDLLYRHRIGELAMDPVAIVSNHPAGATPLDGIRFHHLPTTDGKVVQEAALTRLIADTGAELIVLARYMQILSDDLAASLAGRCINIHHSFLPGFKGAKPYHQAHARGVKMIGATAHYVTGDLDEGPIIAQDVEPISHADTPDDLVRKGREIESRVLARAVRYHLEDRVLLNGAKTVVFGD